MDEKLQSITGIKEESIIESIVKLYNEPIKSDEYLISVDCQEEGTHYNAITVLNLSKNARIEATCLTRMNIYTTIVALSKRYNMARVMIERNRGFYLIKKFEENNIANLLLPNIKYIPKTDTYEFDLDKDGKPNKLGFVTLKNTRDKLLIYLSEYVYNAKELPEDFLDEATKFVIKRGKAVGLEHDDLLMSTGIGLLTNAVLIESKNKSKGDKKLKDFFEYYFKETKFNIHAKNSKKLKDDIKSDLKKIVMRNHLLIGESNSMGAIELDLLEKIAGNKVTGKIGKALSGMMF